MPTVQPFPAGGYRFISHQFQYSGGVAAEPGFRIERARSFIAAGSGEAREGDPSYEGRIIRRGDQSSEAMREKALFAFSRGRRSHFDKAVSATVA
jgi:hypothetical protein